MVSVPEGVLHLLETGALLQCDFPCGALITHGNRPMLPFFEIGLFALSGLHSGGIAFVIFVVDGDGLVIYGLLLVLLCGGKLLTVTVLTFGHPTTVVDIQFSHMAYQGHFRDVSAKDEISELLPRRKQISSTNTAHESLSACLGVTGMLS